MDNIMNNIFDNHDTEHYGESGTDVKNLIKALQAQEGVTDIADLQDGGALQVQSLETQLAMLTFQEKHLKFYKDIGVVKAYSTLEEYSTQDGYGTEGGFVGQLENPEEDDADINREFAVVKYIRGLWRVSDVLGFTKTISNAEVIQVQAAMMRTLRTLERTLFFGDSDKIPQSFDGLERTILTKGSSYQVIDLRGAQITEANMKLAAEIISSNYGTPTTMYNSLSVQTTIDQILGNTTNQRLNIEQLGGNGKMALGSSVSEMRTAFGNFEIKPDIFINPESQGVPTIKNPANKSAIIEGATSTKAPATPTFSIAVNAPTVAGSKWKTSGDGGAIAGAYKYRVAAINQYGKSAAAVAQTSTVAANGALTLSITPGAGAYAATAYEIYRETAPGSGIIKLLTIVKADASPKTHQDLNDDLSGTSKSFLVDNTTLGDLRTMALSQLAPMHKVNYAKIGPYRWGTVNMYAVPKWYSPQRFVLFKNVGVQALVRNTVIDL
jgi:hypothetical protein